jgi:hypothetical protein
MVMKALALWLIFMNVPSKWNLSRPARLALLMVRIWEAAAQQQSKEWMRGTFVQHAHVYGCGADLMHEYYVMR